MKNIKYGIILGLLLIVILFLNLPSLSADNNSCESSEIKQLVAQSLKNALSKTHACPAVHFGSLNNSANFSIEKAQEDFYNKKTRFCSGNLVIKSKTNNKAIFTWANMYDIGDRKDVYKIACPIDYTFFKGTDGKTHFTCTNSSLTCKYYTDKGILNNIEVWD